MNSLFKVKNVIRIVENVCTYLGIITQITYDVKDYNYLN